MAGTDRTAAAGRGGGAVLLIAVLATASLAGGAAAHASSEDHGTLTFHDTEDGPPQSSPGGVEDPVEIACEFWIRGANASHAHGTILAHHDLSSRHPHTHEPARWNASADASQRASFEVGPLTLHEDDVWEVQTTTGTEDHTTRLHRVEYEACPRKPPAASPPDEHVPEPCLSEIRAEARESGDVALAWNGTGADGFHVYRATGGELEHRAQTVEASFVDEETRAHTTYQYRVATSTDVDPGACPAATVTAIPFLASSLAAFAAAVGGLGVVVGLRDGR